MSTAADQSEHIIRDRRADVRGFGGAIQVQFHGDRCPVWHRCIRLARHHLRLHRVQAKVAREQSGDEANAKPDGRARDPRCQGV